MSKRLGLVFAGLFFLVMAQSAFSASFTKEFTFELAPGETTKNWEINVPLPANKTGKFISRDFKPLEDPTKGELIFEKEVFADKNYYLKGRLVRVATGTLTAVSSKLQIDIGIGETKPNDIPQAVRTLGIKAPFPFEMNWTGVGDTGKPFPVSAKYLYCQIKDGATGALLAEELVPVHLVGFHFPIKYDLKEKVKYEFVVQLSNASGEYSKPVNMKYEFVPMDKK